MCVCVCVCGVNIHIVCVCVCVCWGVREREIAHQAPLSMEFSRQEYWSSLPFLPPEDRPDSGIKPASPALAGGFFTTTPPRKPIYTLLYTK